MYSLSAKKADNGKHKDMCVAEMAKPSPLFFLKGVAHQRLQLTLNAILHPLAHCLTYLKEGVSLFIVFFFFFVLLSFIVTKVFNFQHYGTR